MKHTQSRTHTLICRAVASVSSIPAGFCDTSIKSLRKQKSEQEQSKRCVLSRFLHNAVKKIELFRFPANDTRALTLLHIGYHTFASLRCHTPARLLIRYLICVFETNKKCFEQRNCCVYFPASPRGTGFAALRASEAPRSGAADDFFESTRLRSVFMSSCLLPLQPIHSASVKRDELSEGSEMRNNCNRINHNEQMKTH